MGLVLTVARELHDRGFPEFRGDDLAYLLEALFGFIYEPAGQSFYERVQADRRRAGWVPPDEPQNAESMESAMESSLDRDQADSERRPKRSRTRPNPPHSPDYGRTGPSVIDESRPVGPVCTCPPKSNWHLDGCPRRAWLKTNPAEQGLQRPAAPWNQYDQAVPPWNEGPPVDDAAGFLARVVDHLATRETDQPPACERHDWSALDCVECGDRAFYVELGRRMAETADEGDPCAGGRCIDPAAHAEGAHDQ
jgi:hypothetical protein